MRPRAIGERHLGAHFVIRTRVGTERARVALVERMQARDEALGADDVEATMSVAEIEVDRLARMDDAREFRHPRAKHGANVRIDVAAAEVFGIADAK